MNTKNVRPEYLNFYPRQNKNNRKQIHHCPRYKSKQKLCDYNYLIIRTLPPHIIN